MKKCLRCEQEKDELKFYIKTGDRRQSSCKSCFDKYISNRWAKRKVEAFVYKGNKCCDCLVEVSTDNSWIFDFHHLNPLNKELDWNKMRMIGRDKLFVELDKTVLLCSNCHRIRHYKIHLDKIGEAE